MAKGYNIQVYKDKIVISNPIPVDDMMLISKFAEEKLGKDCIMGPSEDGNAGFTILRKQ